MLAYARNYHGIAIASASFKRRSTSSAHHYQRGDVDDARASDDVGHREGIILIVCDATSVRKASQITVGF